MYTMHKKQTSNIRWRCVLRSSHCRGSLVTSTDFKHPRVRMGHNHDPDHAAARLARTRYVALGQPSVFQEGHTNVMFEHVPLLTPAKIKEEPQDDCDRQMETSCRQLIPVIEANQLTAGIVTSPSQVMQSGSQGTSGGRTIRIGQSLVRQPLRNIAPAPSNQHRQQPKTLVLKTIPLKVKQVAPTTIKMAPRPPNIGIPQKVLPQQSTEVCLRWNSYHSNMQNSFPSLLDTEQFVDVTLACEGRSLKCHKMILSSCSDYLAELLRENPCQHPIILMKDLKFWEVEALVKFMYRGEVNVAHEKLPQLLNAAEALQIKGLAGPSPSLQNPKPPKLVPHTKPLNPILINPNARVVAETKEARKSTVPPPPPPPPPTPTTAAAAAAAAAATVPASPKRVHKRQASEPPQPRIFTKIRLQRPATPTSPNPAVKLEPLDIPLSPTEIFSGHRHHHHHHHQQDEDVSSTASNFDNLVMALHEDDDPGGDDDRCSTDGEMNYSDIPGRSDDPNDNDEQMEFVPTDFLEQEQEIVEEADSNDDETDEEEDDDDIEDDTIERSPDIEKNMDMDDRGNENRTEKCTDPDEA